MNGCAFTFHAYANVTHAFVNTNIFSTLISLYHSQWSSVTLMLKNITENVWRTTIWHLFFHWLFFSPSLRQKPISASFWERGSGRDKFNGRVVRNLITGHYEAEMLLWLLCNVTSTGTCNKDGVEGRHVWSVSALCNQSHTPFPHKNKQLDFQLWWSFLRFVFDLSVSLCVRVTDKVVNPWCLCGKCVWYMSDLVSKLWPFMSILISLLWISILQKVTL